MSSNTVKDLARALGKLGEKSNVDGQRLYDLSELTLVAGVEDSKVVPRSLNFTLFGTEFTKTLQDELVLVDTTTDEVESHVVTDEALIAAVDEYLAWRLRMVETFTL